MSKRTICLPNTIFGVLLLSLSELQIVCLLCLLLHGFCSLKYKTLPKLFKMVYCITCFVILIAGISWPTAYLFNFEFSGYCLNFNINIKILMIASISYQLSLICIYSLYFIRLYLSFKNSPYSISKYVSIILIFGLFLQFILFIITQYIYFQFLHGFITRNDNLENLRDIFSLFYQSFIITNIICNVLLLSLLLSKICRLIKQQNKVQNINILIKPTINYTLCLFLSFLSTLIPTSLVWIRSSDLIIDSNEIYMIHLLSISWNIFINALSINLQFKYTKTCQFCCDCIMNNIQIENLKNNVDIELTEKSKHDYYNNGPCNVQSLSSSSTTNGITSSTTNGVGLPVLNKSITSQQFQSTTYIHHQL